MKIIRVLTDSGQLIFLTEENGRYVPLPDDFWRRKIPNYRYLTGTGRQKQQKKLLKTVDVKSIRVSTDFPPARKRSAATMTSARQRRRTVDKVWRL